jgi:hypothetical protein
VAVHGGKKRQLTSDKVQHEYIGLTYFSRAYTGSRDVLYSAELSEGRSGGNLTVAEKGGGDETVGVR